jgi:hypothetical protein
MNNPEKNSGELIWPDKKIHIIPWTSPGRRISTISTSISGDYKADQVITTLQLEIGHGKLTNESTIIFYSIRTESSLGNTQLRTNLRTDKK